METFLYLHVKLIFLEGLLQSLYRLGISCLVRYNYHSPGWWRKQNLILGRPALFMNHFLRQKGVLTQTCFMHIKFMCTYIYVENRYIYIYIYLFICSKILFSQIPWCFFPRLYSVWAVYTICHICLALSYIISCLN